MEQPHYYAQDLPPHHSSWMEQQHQQHQQHPYHSQHHSPILDYPPFAFPPPPPSPYDPGFHPHPPPPAASSRPSHHQLQPLVTTPWPSSLAAQASFSSLPVPPPPPALQPAPHSSSSASTLPLPTSMAPSAPPPSSHPPTQHGNTARRTLTDHDRRAMCLYHEENPNKKQTEIGEIFGVERSTVSKVLRQKEKYLTSNDGSQSPLKKSNKKYPDIERTLAKWAQNQQGKGVPVTDELLKRQAHIWWTATGNGSEMPVPIDNPAWLDKFRQKHSLTGTKSRKSSIKSIPSPRIDSPASPGLQSRTDSPLTAETPILQRRGSAGMDPLGIRGTRVPFHSQSNTSLSSAFTDQAPPFSSDGGSTAVSPDGVSSTSSYFPPPLPHAMSASNSLRPRSQTFPVTAPGDPYISPPQSADASSPHYSIPNAVFESPTSDMPPPSMKPHPQLAPNPPAALHAKSMPSLKMKSLHDADAPPQPSLLDARRGLEAAMHYLSAQPSAGWDAADMAAMRKIMSQLKLQESGSLPGGLHRIPEQEFGRSEDDVDMGGFAPADAQAAATRAAAAHVPVSIAPAPVKAEAR